MSGPAPTSWQPPRVPPELAKRSCLIIAPDAAGNWFGWRFIWGEYAGTAPTFLGESRAAVNRNLQGIGLDVPVWVEPEGAL
jgi:hypothetical protein